MKRDSITMPSIKEIVIGLIKVNDNRIIKL